MHVSEWQSSPLAGVGKDAAQGPHPLIELFVDTLAYTYLVEVYIVYIHICMCVQLLYTHVVYIMRMLYEHVCHRLPVHNCTQLYPPECSLTDVTSCRGEQR
jgi:hypothetical protein